VSHSDEKADPDRIKSRVEIVAINETHAKISTWQKNSAYTAGTEDMNETNAFRCNIAKAFHIGDIRVRNVRRIRREDSFRRTQESHQNNAGDEGREGIGEEPKDSTVERGCREQAV